LLHTPQAPVVQTYLDEWADQEEPVCQANLNTAQDWCNTGTVGWQRGQVGSNDGGGGHWCLQEPNERIAVHWLNDLGLRIVQDAVMAGSI
jgi:hypothetical protein